MLCTVVNRSLCNAGSDLWDLKIAFTSLNSVYIYIYTVEKEDVKYCMYTHNTNTACLHCETSLY